MCVYVHRHFSADATQLRKRRHRDDNVITDTRRLNNGLVRMLGDQTSAQMSNHERSMIVPEWVGKEEPVGRPAPIGELCSRFVNQVERRFCGATEFRESALRNHFTHTLFTRLRPECGAHLLRHGSRSANHG